MAAPPRGNTGYSIYFITASTFQRKLLFRQEPMARLFVDVLFHYRDHKNYLLQEFVLMRDHFHLLISPALSLERSLQLIKGGFSYRARKELGFAGEIWEKSFYDRRVRGADDYYNFKRYIRQNPIKEGLGSSPGDYPYSSARPEFVLDQVPQRLKPSTLTARVAALKALRHPKAIIRQVVSKQRAMRNEDLGSRRPGLSRFLKEARLLAARGGHRRGSVHVGRCDNQAPRVAHPSVVCPSPIPGFPILYRASPPSPQERGC